MPGAAFWAECSRTCCILHAASKFTRARQEAGHVRQRVLHYYGRVHKFVRGTSYMHAK